MLSRQASAMQATLLRNTRSQKVPDTCGLEEGVRQSQSISINPNSSSLGVGLGRIWVLHVPPLQPQDRAVIIPILVRKLRLRENKPFNTLMRAQASVPLAVWFLSPLSQRTSPKAGAASPLPYTSFSTPRSIVPDDFQHC